MKGVWVPHDTRDQIVDYMKYWSERAEQPVGQLLNWLGLASSKYHTWKHRYGKANEHNGKIPRDWWIEAWEKQAILDYHDQHPLEGYRRLTFMMLDDDVVAVSPSTTYRVLKASGRLDRKPVGSSKKGTGFVQPESPHKHWHVDIAYLNLGGTFYFLITVLDGMSRFIVHWEISPTMTELDVEIVVQRALEKHPDARPRIISDNGPQFIAKDFKKFIRFAGLTHVRTSPYYPQSNGKLERWHGVLKQECMRPSSPDTLEQATKHVTDFVQHYNFVRLHSAIGYITPSDCLSGLGKVIAQERDRKLEEARARRQARRGAQLVA
jgi:transposase InsO family protein